MRVPMHKRLIGYAVNLGIFAVALVLGGLLVEFGFRAYLYGSLKRPDFESLMDHIRPHAQLGWALVPNSFTWSQKRDFKVGVHVNSKGLRDDEHAYEKPKSAYRILLLGDSFMEAQQVFLDQSLGKLLEHQLKANRVEVVCAGVNGYSPVQSLLYLKTEGMKYSPDLVLFACYPTNDVAEMVRPLLDLAVGKDSRLSYGRPYASIRPDGSGLAFVAPDYDRALATWTEEKRKRDMERDSRTWLERSVVKKFYDDERAKKEHQSNMHQFASMIWYGVCLGSIDTSCLDGKLPDGSVIEAYFEDGWSMLSEVLLEMRDVSREHGAAFAVVIVPAKFQIEPEYRDRYAPFACSEWDLDLWAPNRRLAAITELVQVPLCDLGPVFDDAYKAGKRPLYFGWDDDHWTPQGHALAATAVSAFVRRFLPEQ